MRSVQDLFRILLYKKGAKNSKLINHVDTILRIRISRYPKMRYSCQLLTSVYHFERCNRVLVANIFSLNENESLLQKSPASRNNPPPPPWECTIICRDNAGSPIFQHLVNFQFYTPISKGECGGTFSGAVINASKYYSEQEFLPPLER